MRLAHWHERSDRLILVESSDLVEGGSGMGVDGLEIWLSDPDFDGILWDNKGLKRVLTRDILQEGLDIYLASHLNPRAPIASHVGVFLWEQAISREEADQRSQARTGDGTGPEDKPDQGPLES